MEEKDIMARLKMAEGLQIVFWHFPTIEIRNI